VDEWIRTWYTLWVILNANSIIVLVTVDNFTQTSRFDGPPLGSSVRVLHYDHVTAVAALGQEPASGGIGSERRDHLYDCELKEVEKGCWTVPYFNDVAAYSDYTDPYW
jgi:hypothetical protein